MVPRCGQRFGLASGHWSIGIHDVVLETHPRRGQYLDPLSEQNEACDWIAFNNADGLEVLKHAATDATQVPALFVSYKEDGLGGFWF